MPSHAEFSSLPGFSKLFKDFFIKDSFIWQRFPANHNPGKTFKKRLESFKNRDAMQGIFAASMAKLDVTVEQEKNLELLKNGNSLVVITGQQVGLFGGALYTFFKAQSAIAQAKKFSKECPEYNFVPVFWVEDNDHDRAEAEHTTILTKNYEILPLKAPGDLQNQQNARVGEIRLTDDITPFLDELASQLSSSPYSADIAALLKEIYTPGKLWSDAYTELLHRFFKSSGLLFVKGSEVRKSGLSREILLKELTTVGASKSVAEKAGAGLLKNGYHVQAEPSDVHLFLHEGTQRFKINVSNDGEFLVNNEKYLKEEILKTAEHQPERFSPNVLLRPIVQDVVFPTAAYIAGPGELSYAAELCEMYEYFGVVMPMFIPRHSATFVEYKAEKLLVKENLNIRDFMKSWQEIEQDLTKKISDKEINNLFKKNENDVKEFFKKLHQKAVVIDTTLGGAVEASQTMTQKQFAKIFKKINAAQKRHESGLFKKYRETWMMIYPGGLQERIFSVVHYLSEYGEESVRAALENFNRIEPVGHFFVSMKRNGKVTEGKNQ